MTLREEVGAVMMGGCKGHPTDAVLAVWGPSRSGGGVSERAIPAACGAAMAVCASARLPHSTPSTWTTLPPAIPLGGSFLGT